MKMENAKLVLSANRAEELGLDVWERFVIPPFYERLDLLEAQKPRIIVGGRGCGKTMILRYFSHYSVFSKNRPHVPDSAADHVGLYWKIDTQFARAMRERGLSESQWVEAFNHFLALNILRELLAALENIASRHFLGITPERLNHMRLDTLASYGLDFKGSFLDLRALVKGFLRLFEAWLANIKKLPEPIFFNGFVFLISVLEDIRESLPELEMARFYIYVDEFENLHSYQQKAIATALKHSQSPLILNIAVKRNSLPKDIFGDESLSEVHDYRVVDLEMLLLESGFELFAAEVLCLNLVLARLIEYPDLPSLLRSPDRMSERESPSYRDGILARTKRIFPGMTQRDLAVDALKQKHIQKKLRNQISAALKSKSSTLDEDAFIDTEHPEASVIMPALLNRAGNSPQEILEEFKKLAAGQTNHFDGKTNWIHNNFIGCLLYLYDSTPNPCPLYSGFSTFCAISRGNLRHFLELCHKSLSRMSDQTTLTVMPRDQARAAHQASTALLGEVRSFGPYGNKLYSLVLRLGSLFALAHRRPTQSEPEQNHFAITKGGAVLSTDSLDLLREAVKFSVVFEEEPTKVKEDETVLDYDYVLNPIYAPYFNISYRKKRKLELSSEEFNTIALGSYDEVRELLRNFTRKWNVDIANESQMLFSHLKEE